MASTMKQADANNGVPMPAQERARKWHAFTLKFKRDVAAQCLQPGATVSRITLSDGINANVVRKWLPQGRAATSAAVPTMLPVSVQPSVVVVSPEARSTATSHSVPRRRDGRYCRNDPRHPCRSHLSYCLASYGEAFREEMNRPKKSRTNRS